MLGLRLRNPFGFVFPAFSHTSSGNQMGLLQRNISGVQTENYHPLRLSGALLARLFAYCAKDAELKVNN
jgi:hypothetical protein